MKKTLFKVIVYIFCVFSIVELCAEESMDELEKKPESEVTPDLEAVVIELAAGIYSTLNTKINSLNKDILLLKNQYKLLSEKQVINAQEQSESEGGLDLEVAFFKLNAKVNSLNDDILALKNQYELLIEEQRLNTQKITELFDMLELKYTKEAVK